MLTPPPSVPRDADKHVPGEILVRLRTQSEADDALVRAGVDRQASKSKTQTTERVDAFLNRLQARSAEPAMRHVPRKLAAPGRKGPAVAATNAEMEQKRAALFRWIRVRLPDDMKVEDALAAAKGDALVEAAEPVYEWRLTDFIDPPIENLPDGTTDPAFDLQWHFINAKIPQAWNYLNTNGVNGGGLHSVVAAVVDSGVDYNHEDLIGNIWTNPDEIPNNGIDDDSNGFVDDIHGCCVVSDGRSHSGDPIDLHGHGTHVAGIIVAQAFNHLGGVGVAFNCQVMPIRAAHYAGLLTTTDIAEGITYATDNGAEVINMSFGGYQYSQVVTDAIEVALSQAVLVAAAGNDSRAYPPLYPAALPWVIGVMASTPSDTLSWYSNYGSYYNICAPGDSIYSTLPGNIYAKWSGTSMATPVVSGVAALMRSYFWQREIWSSRFLAASIVGNKTEELGEGRLGSGGVVDAYKALTTPPKPGVSVLDYWLFDDSGIHSANDDDGRIDAGETVHIGVELINRGGQADMVIATLEARAPGAVQDDPYVSIDLPVIDFGSMGPFTTKDNGFIYDQQGVITGVTDPFIVTVDPNTPNDHIINFIMTTHFLDGWNPEEPGPYYRVDQFQYIVQRGRNIPTVITSGTTMELTSDEYWMVGGPVLVEAGATLKIMPGTQVQWGSVSDDPYNSGPQTGYIIVRGTLDIAGTVDKPVNMFPSYMVSGQTTDIRVEANGVCDMSYAKVRNPRLTGLRSIDHAYLEWDAYSSTVVAPSVTNSIFHKFRGGGNIQAMAFDTCLFDAGWVNPSSWPSYLVGDYRRQCVYLQDNENVVPLSISTPGSVRIPTPNPETPGALLGNLQVWNGSTYVRFHGWDDGMDDYTSFRVAEAIANYYGGHVVCIRDAAEDSFLRSYVFAAQATLPGRHRPYLIGLTDEEKLGNYKWIDGSPVTFTAWSSPVTAPPGCLVSLYGFDDRGLQYPGWGFFDGYPGHDRQFILRIPGEWTLEALGLPNNGDTVGYVLQNCPSNVRHNAFLNRYWDPNVNHWMRFIAPSNASNWYSLMRDNYWGTDSTTLIDHAIVDYYDNFTSARVDYGTPPDHGFPGTYPFVESVSIAGLPAHTVPEIGAGPTTFSITFNRDMDTTIQPFVTFGPTPPHTDFTVEAIGDGWTSPRTWEGTFWITPVTGEGYHLMRISGAVAASDPWLVSGYDVGRFRFEIKTMGIAAMTLQATGQEGAIHVSWQQDDFDLLAGYHLYRSSTIDGAYERINATIIPVGQESYTDTNVTPAVPMFYKFTVVQTDLLESGFSNVASAAALDTIPPVLTHTPPTIAPPGAGLRLTATATDNVSVSTVKAFYRPLGSTGNYTPLLMTRITGSQYSAVIPGSAVQPPGVEYYLLATDGISQVYDATPAVPHQVVVTHQPSLTSVTPNHGPAEGGTPVALAGTLFQQGASVFFDAALASNIVVVSPNQITCTTPLHFPAEVDVKVVNPDDSQAVRLKGYSYENVGAVLSLPQTSGDYGTMVELDLTASNVVGLRAADVTVTFNPAVLSVSEIECGTLTVGWALSYNLSPPGTIRISLASATEVTGSGSLARLQCQVIGAPPASTDLTIAPATLNDGALTFETSHGVFLVNGFFTVAGAVSYYSGGHLPGVALITQGDGSYAAVSDAATGTYSITNIPTGSYTLTPSKTDSVAEITALDASYVLQTSVGSRTLSSHQAIAADVNHNGSVSAMDAAYILEKSVGLREVPFPGSGRIWSFDPENRTYPLFNNDQAGQDFFGILLGDVTGNWTALSGMLAWRGCEDDAASISLRLPNVTSRLGGRASLSMALSVGNATMHAANMLISYDPAVLSLDEVVLGPAAENMLLAVNPLPAGNIRIGLAGSQAVSRSGTLLNISFTVIGVDNAPVPVVFQQVEIDEGTVCATAEDGSVTLAFATGDLDRDGDIDVADLHRLTSCSLGPTVRQPDPACQSVDFDKDGDVDQTDFGILQQCYSGSGVPADPDCDH